MVLLEPAKGHATGGPRAGGQGLHTTYADLHRFRGRGVRNAYAMSSQPNLAPTMCLTLGADDAMGVWECNMQLVEANIVAEHDPP